MKQKELIYTVEAARSTPFPIDMLRYDSSWPASERDSQRIMDAINDPRSGRRVVLKTRMPVPLLPESGRWSSFGWRVYIGDHREERGTDE